MQIKNTNTQESETVELLNDMKYVCKSGALITKALKHGSDVMQLPNGDILINEIKTITSCYCWNKEKGVFVRKHSSSFVIA